nr:uncharacterized protein LOC106731859 [Pelodiscus sinensis]|eukprot:XP_014427950.1 uncharacterized protein LOC106731859 [Pelodiscus sinensis]
MPTSDGHTVCVSCLGESHVPPKCVHCLKLTPRAHRDRDLRLKLLLCDKALQPPQTTQEQTVAPKRRALSPGVPKTKKKKTSPTRSLPAVPLPRVSQEKSEARPASTTLPRSVAEQAKPHTASASEAAAPTHREHVHTRTPSGDKLAMPLMPPTKPPDRELSPQQRDESEAATGSGPLRKASPTPPTGASTGRSREHTEAPGDHGSPRGADRADGTAGEEFPRSSPAPCQGKALTRCCLTARCHAKALTPCLGKSLTPSRELLSPPTPQAPRLQSLPSRHSQPACAEHHHGNTAGDLTAAQQSLAAVPTNTARKSAPRYHSRSPSLYFSLEPSPPACHSDMGAYSSAYNSDHRRSCSNYSYRRGSLHRSRSPTCSPPRSYRSRHNSRYTSRRSSPDYDYHTHRSYHAPIRKGRSHSHSHSCCCHQPYHRRASPHAPEYQRLHSPKPPLPTAPSTSVLSDPEEGQISDTGEHTPAASPGDVQSPSPDDAVFVGDPSPPDDAREFQDLFKRVAQSQEVQLTDVQAKQHKLWKNLHPRHQSRTALPLDEAILESASEIWNTPASVTPSCKREEKRYFIAAKGAEFLFTHPQPNSLVVDAALQRAKNPQVRNSAADKDAKKLDTFGRKVYSSSTLLLRIANYAALLSNHSFDNIARLTEIAQRISEADRVSSAR